MKKNSYLFILIIIAFGCKPAFYNQITVSEISETMQFLASDSLKGRYPGTAEDSVLAYFVAEKMDISGMTFPVENGLQEVEVEHGFKITDNNRMIISGKQDENTIISDITVFGFSATDTVNGKALFAKDLEAIGESSIEGMVLMFPFPDDLPSEDYDRYSKLRSIGLKAADLGAEALIFVARGPVKQIMSENRSSLPIPVIAVSHSEILSYLSSVADNLNIDLFLWDLPSFKTKIEIEIQTEVVPEIITTYNTVAKLKGISSTLSNQLIVVGAHHDHLGMGGRGSSSRRQDTIGVHYGADDNASGVSGLIELAQHLMSRSPSRSFLFTSFAGEEMGLHGSKALVSSDIIYPENVQAMINLDMIGRLNEDRQLQIGGVGTSPVFMAIIDTVNKKYNFNLTISEAGFGPSDHASFYAEDIPVLFFSTGAHTDYHTPMDTPDKINYEGMVEVLSFVSDVAFEISEIPEKIQFTMAGPKESSGSRGRQGMVTFGLMPDVMYEGNDGMPVNFVTEGKPAAIGGMKGGDIIIAVDGKSVGNVHDYMERLSELKEGQSVVVRINRDGEIIDLLLKL